MSSVTVKMSDTPLIMYESPTNPWMDGSDLAAPVRGLSNLFLLMYLFFFCMQLTGFTKALTRSGVTEEAQMLRKNYPLTYLFIYIVSANGLQGILNARVQMFNEYCHFFAPALFAILSLIIPSYLAIHIYLWAKLGPLIQPPGTTNTATATRTYTQKIVQRLPKWFPTVGVFFIWISLVIPHLGIALHTYIHQAEADLCANPFAFINIQALFFFYGLFLLAAIAFSAPLRYVYKCVFINTIITLICFSAFAGGSWTATHRYGEVNTLSGNDSVQLMLGLLIGATLGTMFWTSVQIEDQMWLKSWPIRYFRCCVPGLAEKPNRDPRDVESHISALPMFGKGKDKKYSKLNADEFDDDEEIFNRDDDLEGSSSAIKAQKSALLRGHEDGDTGKTIMAMTMPSIFSGEIWDPKLNAVKFTVTHYYGNVSTDNLFDKTIVHIPDEGMLLHFCFHLRYIQQRIKNNEQMKFLFMFICQTVYLMVLPDAILANYEMYTKNLTSVSRFTPSIAAEINIITKNKGKDTADSIRAMDKIGRICIRVLFVGLNEGGDAIKK